MASSTISFNAGGVNVEYGDAGVDLSGGKFGGTNTIACNLGAVGNGSVLSYGLNPVNASNVAWDTPGPNVFVWTPDAGLTCEVSECTALGSAGIVTDAISWFPSPEVVTTGHTLLAAAVRE